MFNEYVDNLDTIKYLIYRVFAMLYHYFQIFTDKRINSNKFNIVFSQGFLSDTKSEQSLLILKIVNELNILLNTDLITN